jgi:hypothetical protein
MPSDPPDCRSEPSATIDTPRADVQPNGVVEPEVSPHDKPTGEDHKETGEATAKEPSDEPENSGGNKTPKHLQQLSDSVKSAKTLFLNLFLMLVIVGCLVAVGHEFNANPIILEPIEIPESLQKTGVTSASISKRIADEIVDLQDKSSEGLSRRRLLEPSWLLADIQVPGGGLSVHTVVSFFKQEFGLSESDSNLKPNERVVV